MNKMLVSITANPEGRYPTVEILKQIKAACKEVVFPNKPIEHTCLADLSVNGDVCYYGVSEGVWDSWDNNAVTYRERILTLYFASELELNRE
jgi:hypothetical protein